MAHAWAVPLVAALLVLRASAASVPYLASRLPTSKVWAVANSGRSKAELLALSSLAGNLARESPRLYRVSSAAWASDAGDSASVFLKDLQSNHKVEVDSSLVTATLGQVLAHFRGEVSGFVRCNEADASTSAAFTLAAAAEGLLVAADDAAAAAMQQVGLLLLRDLRGKAVKDVLPEALPNLSTRVFVFQDTSKAEFVNDYAVFARAASLQYGSDEDSQNKLLVRATPPGVALGWGPENDFVATCSQHGVWVHASDYNVNLPALGNMQVSRSDETVQTSIASPRDVHTVAFVMSDGDNLQWTLGSWSIDQHWFGSSKRGSVPIGWTFSPATAFLAPSVTQRVRSALTSEDELVAGPSGIGYMYPTKWPAAYLADYAALTAEGMKRSGMRIVNVIGQGDDPPSFLRSVQEAEAAPTPPLGFPKSLLEPWLAQQDVDGMFYYPYGDCYAGLKGGIWFVGEKPVISARYSLWGNVTSGECLGVEALTQRLKAMPKTPMTADGYSLVAVHAWTHGYDDVLAVAAALQKEPGFEVVLPSELLRRVKANVHQTGLLVV